MNEAALTTKLRKHLKSEGAYVFKARGDPRQTKGVPDLVACYRGIFLGLEVKVPGRERTVTLNQQENLNRIEEAGGIARVVVSLNDVKEVLTIADGRVEE